VLTHVALEGEDSDGGCHACRLEGLADCAHTTSGGLCSNTTVKVHTHQAWSLSDLALGLAVRDRHPVRPALSRRVHRSDEREATGRICTYHLSNGKLDHCNRQVTVTKVDAKTIKAVFKVSAVHQC
jgi:hypothetical protein